MRSITSMIFDLRQEQQFHGHPAACGGQSIAAPRTPLESPWALGTSLVRTTSENIQLREERRHALVERLDVRHAAAQHDDVRVDDVDDRGERAGKAFLVALQGG